MNSSSGDCSVFGRNILEPENASLTLDRLDESFKQTITTIQLIISVFGIVGHILSLVVLITTKSLHTTPNFFIGVLSAVDLLLCLTIPVSSVQIVIDNNNNAIQPELCKAIGSIIVISMSASLACMMLIAVNRYVLVVKGKATYKKLYTKAKTGISLLAVSTWLLVVVVIIPETSDFGHFGYNAKFGTCVITSYCMRNYFYMTTLLLLTIFLPASVLTGYAYACIIRKLLIMRRKIELNEKINLVKPGIALKDFKVDDSRMETSQATEHIAVGNDSAYDLLDEESEYRKEMADYRSRVEKAFMVQQSQPDSADSRRQPKTTPLKPIEEKRGTFSRSEPNLNKLSEDINANMVFERSATFSFRRSISTTSRIKWRTSRAMAKLRRPQWRRLCMAIANMITIYVLLWICWAPMLIQYIRDVDGLLPAYSYRIEVTFVYFNSAFNLLLYAIMNNKHRKAYKKLLKRCLRIK